MSQKLAEDVGGSIAVAKPLFRLLSTWRESLPQYTHHGCLSEGQSRYPASVYFAYLTLVACVWRAVLRATVASSDPPQVIDFHEDESAAAAADLGSLSVEDVSFELNPYPEINFRSAGDADAGQDGTLMQELYEASLNCASNAIQFSANLTMPAFSEFWHSCKWQAPPQLLFGHAFFTFNANSIVQSIGYANFNVYQYRVPHELRAHVQLPHPAASPGA